MTTATLTRTSSETGTDEHFLARMEQATTDERDAVFAELASSAVNGDELAARTIRQLLLPTCRKITGTRGDQFLAAVVDAAYDEVVDWARSSR
jgi:hypothetical protein